MSELELGAIRADEIDAVLAIDRAAFSKNGEPPSLDLREEVARAWSRVWVARAEGAPVAYLVAWHVADELHLLAIATRADVRRKGAGRALLHRLVEHGYDHDVLHVFLEVRASNDAAIALYRAFGFYRLNVRKAYYGDGEDAVEMALALDPPVRKILPHADEA